MTSAEATLPSDLAELPEGWSYEVLGNLVGDPGICYGIVQPGRETEGGVPIVRVNNIRNRRIDTDDVKRVAPSVADKIRAVMLTRRRSSSHVSWDAWRSCNCST